MEKRLNALGEDVSESMSESYITTTILCQPALRAVLMNWWNIHELVSEYQTEPTLHTYVKVYTKMEQVTTIQVLIIYQKICPYFKGSIYISSDLGTGLWTHLKTT